MLCEIPESRDVVEATADKVLINYGDHIMDIERVISAALQEIVDEIPKAKQLFKVSQVLKVGGFNEGTKILAPDEFDYIAVLEHLSEPGVIQIVPEDDDPGIVKVKINDTHNHDGKWDNFIRDDYLRCMQIEALDSSAVKSFDFENFGIEVINAIRRLYKAKGRPGVGTNTLQEYGDHPKAYRQFASDIDKAWIKSAEVKFPNVLLEFIIENRTVDVDLSPAIRHLNVRDCFQPDDCPFPNLAESVINRGSILLVGQLQNQFRITYTETEVDYLKNCMSLKHKKLYIYMKYVAHVVDQKVRWSLFPSYTLKIACIKHDILCNNTGDRFLPCLSDLLLLYVNACNLSSLPSVFNKNLDIMKRSHTFNSVTYQEMRSRVLPFLKKIPELITNATTRVQHMQDLSDLFIQCRKSFNNMHPTRDFFEVLYSRKEWLYY